MHSAYSNVSGANSSYSAGSSSYSGGSLRSHKNGSILDTMGGGASSSTLQPRRSTRVGHNPAEYSEQADKARCVGPPAPFFLPDPDPGAMAMVFVPIGRSYFS